MAENALKLDTTGRYVTVNAATVINNLSAYTLLALVRSTNPLPSAFNVLARKASSDTGTNTAGWRWIYDGTQATGAARVRIGHATSELSYSTTTNTPRPIGASVGDWFWTAIAVDLGASNTNRVRVYSNPYGGVSFSETSKTGTTEPSGALTDDSANGIRIGAGAEPPDIAFFGMRSGQLSAANLQSWVADMSGNAAGCLLAVRLGFGGASSAPDVSGNGLTTSVVGSPTLVTDAPDYWTGGSTPSAAAKARYRRLANFTNV